MFVVNLPLKLNNLTVKL